jgi:hypothetical protein
MNREEIKHLFVPVSERLPEKEQWVYCFDYYREKKLFMILPENKFKYYNITHWLDFSILTTKSKAIELAEQVAGYSYSLGFGGVTFNNSREKVLNYISENKKVL